MRKLSALTVLVASLFVGSSFANTNVPVVVNDSVITTEIKTKMLSDKLISALDVKVETTNGIVTLSGDAKSNAEVERAIEIAFGTSGVKEVDASNLNVLGSNKPLTDAIITAKVKGIFTREKLFGDQPIAPMDIHVETVDGIVSLVGKVKDKAQAETAEKLAKQVKGVKEVKSDLKLK